MTKQVAVTRLAQLAEHLLLFFCGDASIVCPGTGGSSPIIGLVELTDVSERISLCQSYML
jgi:hypothetical protein